MKILVIGYGNEMKGDDNLGPFVVRELEQELTSFSDEIRFMALPRLELTMASELSRVHAVLFVSAREDEDTAQVIVRQAFPAPGPMKVASSLVVPIPYLLQAARDWYNAIPSCYEVLPKGYEFPDAMSLSIRARVVAGLARRSLLDLITIFVGMRL